MELWTILERVSVLLTFLSFITGITSLRELGAWRRPHDRRLPSPERRLRLKWILGLSIPTFIGSLVITLNAGLHGSDTGGSQFILLLLGGLWLTLYAIKLRHSWSWAGFLATAVVMLASLGLLFGVISRGEEAEGLQAGIMIGLATGLLGLAFRPASPIVLAGSNAQEKQLLRLASRRHGRLSVSEVALHTTLGLDDARRMLDQLADRQFCERRQEAGGAIIYYFPDFNHNK